MKNSADMASPGLLDRLKDSLSPDSLATRFNLTKSKLIEMGIYLIAGFVIGYLFKKYNRFVFTVIFSVLVLVILYHLDLISISINWARLQDLLGIHSLPADTNLLSASWEWVRSNVGSVLSFLVGFLIGMRLA